MSNYKDKAFIKLDSGNSGVLMSLIKRNLGISGVFDFYKTKEKEIAYKDVSHILPKVYIDIVVKRSNIKNGLKNFIFVIKEDYFLTF